MLNTLEYIKKLGVDYLVKSKLKSKLKVRLAELDMKQVELSEILGVKPQTLSGWVRGDNKPSLEHAFRLAKVLECSIYDLWEYED